MDNFDILEILKLGLPGLVFLLSVLSYRLLSREQDKEQASPFMLKTIKQYIYVNVALAVLTLASPIVDNMYFSKSEVLNLQAIAAENLVSGSAAVCHDARYANRYLLVRDHKTDKLIQLFANSVVPCSDQQKLMIALTDAQMLGWEDGMNHATVEIVTALPGFKFTI